MAALETETCRFPGCDRPVEPATETVGRPPRYCELPEHNAQSAFRERRRRSPRASSTARTTTGVASGP